MFMKIKPNISNTFKFLLIKLGSKINSSLAIFQNNTKEFFWYLNSLVYTNPIIGFSLKENLNF